MKESIKYLILNISIWKIFTGIWNIWLHLLGKIYPSYIVEDMDEFNKFGYYFIKYLGIPVIIFIITFLFSFTDLWPFVNSTQNTINKIYELQHKK